MGLILLTAIYASLGQYYAPLAHTYRQQVLDFINRYSVVKVDAESLKVSWRRLSPVLELKNATLRRDSDPIDFLSVIELNASINVLASVRDRGLRLDNLFLKGIDLDIYETQRDIVSKDSVSAWKDIWLEFLDTLEYADTISVEQSFITTALGEMEVFFELGRNDSFRRMRGGLILNDAPMTFVLETAGSLADTEDLRVKAYITAADINFDRLQLDNVLTENPVPEDFSASTEVWLDWHPARGLNVAGSFTAPKLELAKLAPDIGSVEDFHTEFLLAYQNNQQWDLSLTNTSFDFYDRFSQEALRFKMFKENDKRVLKVMAPLLDLAQIHRVLKRIPAIKQHASLDIVNVMQPTGLLKSVDIAIPLEEPLLSKFHGQMDQVSIASYNTLPAVENLSAVVKGSLAQGKISAFSKDFVLHLPAVYHDVLSYDQMDGNFDWQYDRQNGFKLTSSVFHVLGVDGEISGFLGLAFPSNDDTGIDPTMDLLLGVERGNVHSVQKYLPYKMNSELRDWLIFALEDGRVDSAAILYRGSIKKGSDAIDKTVQLGFVTQESSIRFSKDWPAINSAAAVVEVDDTNVDIALNRGNIQGIDIFNTTAYARPSQKFGSWLQLKTDFETASQNILDLLLNSPLADRLQASLQNWHANGDGVGKLSLGLPLSDAKTMVESLELDVKVDLHDNQFVNRKANLVFNSVQGELSYKHDAGLISPSITANLWGSPVEGVVSSKLQDKVWVPEVALNGLLKLSALGEWMKSDLFEFFEHQAQFDASIKATDQGALLSFTSDLVGIVSHLPAPLTKNANDKWRLTGELSLVDGEQSMSIDLKDTLHIDTQFIDYQFTGAQIELFEINKKLPILPGVYLTGQIDSLDLDAWIPVVERYRVLHEKRQNESSIAMGFRDLRVNSLSGFGYNLTGLDLFGDSVLDFWHVFIDDELVRGTIALYGDDRRPRVAMEYIDLAGLTGSSDTISAWQSDDFWLALNPQNIPEIDFSVDDLRRADESLGAWSFEINAENNLLQLTNLNVQNKDFVITGNNDGLGADFSWQKVEQVQYTSFEGKVSVGDLGKFMADLGNTPVLTSESAEFVLDVEYPGSPVNFALQSLQGNVQLAFKDGMFLNAPDSAKGALNMTGLFDFGALVRRLQLDFSDMNNKGVNYKKVDGKLEFSNGYMKVIDAIEIEGPSSEFSITGRADLLNKQVDASLVAVLPLTGNISLITAATASLPAALGVYVVGKLFKPQFDKLSSVVYHITGPWDDPDIKFNKLFDVGRLPSSN